MRAYAETTHRVDLKRQFKEKQMGRPLRKDILGVDVIGTGAAAATARRRRDRPSGPCG